MEPTIVWMVALDGDKRDVEGILAEEDGGLVFTQEASGTVIRFPYTDVSKVSRVMGSPVFVVRSGSDRRNTAFYLTQPPPLGALDDQGRPGAAVPAATTRLRSSGKWRQRRENTRYLAATSSNVREIRDAWVRRIKAGRKERRSR